MSTAAAPGSPSRFAPAALAVPLVLGVLVGTLVSLDPSLSWATVQPLGLGWVTDYMPYLYSIGVAGAAAMLLFAFRARIFEGEPDVLLVGTTIVCMNLSGIGVDELNMTALAAVAMLLGWIAQRALNPARRWSPTAFTAMVLLLLACALVSAAGKETGPYLGLAKLALKCTVALLLVDMVRGLKQVRTAMRVLVVSCVVFGVVAIIQVGASFLLDYQFTLNEDKEMAFVDTPYGQIVEASAFTRESNGLCTILATVSLLLLIQIFTPLGRGRRKGIIGAVLLMWSVAVLAAHRGSWVGIIVGLLIMPFLLQPRRSILWASLATLAVTLGLATGMIEKTLDAINEVRPESLSDRVELMQASVQQSVLHPWDGVGINQFRRFSPHKGWGAHNTPVQLAQDIGMPGALCFVALVLWIGTRLLWGTRFAVAGRMECLALLSGLIVMFTIMQSEPMAYSQAPWIYLALCEAGAQAAIEARRGE